MADAAVELLLENLKDLVDHHYSLIKGVEKDVKRLQRDLNLFQAYLRVPTKKQIRENEILQAIVRQIIDVVYDVEDIIDAYMIESTVSFFTKPMKLSSIAQKAQEVTADAQRIYQSLNMNINNLRGTVGRPPQKPEPQPLRGVNVVGFERTDELDVISIIGMPGLGKTTLAWKIFHDPDIQLEFHTRVWVYVSQEFTTKDVLLDILKQLVTVTEDMCHSSEQEIAD